MEEANSFPSQLRRVGLGRPKKNSNINSDSSGSPEDLSNSRSINQIPSPQLNTSSMTGTGGVRRSVRIASRPGGVTNNVDFVPASAFYHQAQLSSTPTGSSRRPNFISPSLTSPSIPHNLSIGDESFGDDSFIKVVNTVENQTKEYQTKEYQTKESPTDMFNDSIGISEEDIVEMETNSMSRSQQNNQNQSTSQELMRPPKTSPVGVVQENSTNYEDNVQIKRMKSSFEENIIDRNGPYKNPTMLSNNENQDQNQNQRKKYAGRGGKKSKIKSKTNKNRPWNRWRGAYTNQKRGLELSKSVNELSMQKSIHELSTEQRLSLAHWQLPPSVLWKYHQKNITSLFQWQLDCLGNVKVLGGKNLVYSAPTSAGKTMVAEILMLKRVHELKTKAIMILPFVSVAREKMHSLRDLYSGTPIRVEGFMGAINPPGGFKAVDIAICTIEKANSLINRLIEDDELHLVGTIIVDELHLLGDPHRGYLLELLLTKVRYLSLTRKANEEKEASADPEKNEELKNGIEKQMSKEKKREPINIQIIGMSATLPNLGLLAEWLDAELLTTDFRPVPLVELIEINGQLLDYNLEPVREVIDKSIPWRICCDGAGDIDTVLYLSLQTVLEGHSILIFCPTKANCEYIAKKIATIFSKIGNGDSGNLEIQQKLREQLSTESITAVYQQLKQFPFDVDKILEQSIRFGVAFHHAGLTYDERDIIESSFKRGVIRVIAATQTLSAGVNLPARRVIIKTPKFLGTMLCPLTYKQMVGRAGRKGQDTKGESILITDKATCGMGKDLIGKKLTPISSALLGINGRLTKSLKRAMLEVLVSGIVTSRKELLKYIDYSLLALTLTSQENEKTCKKKDPEELIKKPLSLEEIKENIVNDCIEYLTEMDFVRSKIYENEDEQKFSATNLGAACLASSLPPDEGIKVYMELKKARECFVLDGELHIIYQVTPIYLADQWDNKIDWKHYLHIWDNLSAIEQKVADLVGVEEGYITYLAREGPKTKEKTNIYIRFYTALALNELVNEVPISDIIEKYQVDKGLIQNLQQQASIFAGMVTTFCNRMRWYNIETLLSQFQERLEFGVRKELIDLCRIEIMTGSRARILYEADIKTLVDLSKCDPANIEAILHRATAYDGNSIRIMGKSSAITEQELSTAIVQEARDYIKIEFGLEKSDNNSQTETLKNDQDSDNDQESESEVLDDNDNDTNAELSDVNSKNEANDADSDVNMNSKNETNDQEEERKCSSILFESCEEENASDNVLVYKSASIPRDQRQLLDDSNASPSIIDKSNSSGECSNLAKLVDKSLSISNVWVRNCDGDKRPNEIITPRNSMAEVGETPEDDSSEAKHSTPLAYSKPKHKGAHAVDSILSSPGSQSQSNPRVRKKVKLDDSKNKSISEDEGFVIVSEDMFKEFKEQPDLKINDASDDVFEMSEVPTNSDMDSDSDDQAHDDLDLTNNENITNLKEELLPDESVIKIKVVNSRRFLPESLFTNSATLGIDFNVNRPEQSKSQELLNNGIGSKVMRTVETAKLGSQIEYSLSICSSSDENTVWILKWKDTISEKLEIVRLFRKIKRRDINVAIIDSRYCIKRLLKHHKEVDIYKYLPNERSIWDPKVAEWLLQCDDDEKDKQLSLEGLISKHIFKNFEWGNDQEVHLKAYFSYKLMLVLEKELKLDERKLWDHFKDLEMGNIGTLVLMELNGFGVCPQEMERLIRSLKFKSALLELKAFQLVKKEFNLGVPSEVRNILVNKFHKQEANEGTAKSILEKIVQRYDLEIAKVIIEWRKINTALTKVIEFQTDYLKGRKNRINGYCTHFTITGRIVMSDPNLQCVSKCFESLITFTKKDLKELENMKYQNFGTKTKLLSKDLANYSKKHQDEFIQVTSFNVRNMFVPQSKDFVLVSADYSQLELRILASLSEDPKLLRALEPSSSDVFKSIASIWKGIPIDEITDEMRQETKGLVYGIIYGMGMKALSEIMEVTVEEAKTFRTTFLETYSGLEKFKKDTIKSCQKNKYIETVTGRRRYLHFINSDNREWKAKAERQALNSRIQGSATDLVKSATVKLQKRLNTIFGIGCTLPLNYQESRIEKEPQVVYYPILNLHDELIFEVRRSKLESFVRELHGVMSQDVGRRFKNMNFPVVIKYGESWGDMKKFEMAK